jgi:hypothetical protein
VTVKPYAGAVVFTTVRFVLPDGKIEDVQVRSTEAVLRVLRDPVVRDLGSDESFTVLRNSKDGGGPR